MRVVRSMYLPAALHGMEASLLASESLRKLRSSIRRVVWSRRQPLASVGAVLGLLDGPTGCDPTFCVVWFRFRLFCRFLALWPSQVGRAYRLLDAGPAVTVGVDDVAQWHYTPGLLVKWVAFLGSLHWLAGNADLGVVVICGIAHSL